MQTPYSSCIPIELPERQADLPLSYSELQSDKHAVDRQVVITGRPGDIERVVSAAIAEMNEDNPNATLGSQPLKTITLKDYFPTAPQYPAGDGPASFADLEIRLYDLKEDESEDAVWYAVKMIYKHAEQLKLAVFADPNFITANPASGGSGGVNGGPLGNTGGSAPEEAYRMHWAFQAPYSNQYTRRGGINLEGDGGTRKVEEMGAGTRVYVLDTYPLMIGEPEDEDAYQPSPETQQYSPRQQDPGESAWGELTIQRAFLTPPFHLCISRPPRSIEIRYPQDSELPNPDLIDEHGLFVTGLIHRVAPQAEIHLVEVMDAHGRGDLFTLVEVLCLVTRHALQSSKEAERPLRDVVVNLSLEADIPEEMILAQGVRAPIEGLYTSMKDRLQKEDVLYDLLQGAALRFYYAPSLRIPIQMLHRLGAVIVAAAGNDSAERYGNMPMNIPARFPEVIGVGASNLLGEISNFSNLGDILAPGGGHTEPDYPFADIKTFVNPGDDLSPYSMISLVPEAEDNRDGLAFWAGTSFAAPLVSGLAALIQGKSLGIPAAEAPTPDEILQRIQDNARNDVIEVERTLLLDW